VGLREVKSYRRGGFELSSVVVVLGLSSSLEEEGCVCGCWSAFCFSRSWVEKGMGGVARDLRWVMWVRMMGVVAGSA